MFENSELFVILCERILGNSEFSDLLRSWVEVEVRLAAWSCTSTGCMLLQKSAIEWLHDAANRHESQRQSGCAVLHIHA
jgi:hypothetical protein